MADVRSDLMKARASGKSGTVSGHHRYDSARGNPASEA